MQEPFPSGLLSHTRNLGLEPSTAVVVCSHFFKLCVLLPMKKALSLCFLEES